MKRASDICYARVSTYGQTLDAQLEQLRGAGCTKIYREKVTGAHSDRRELVEVDYDGPGCLDSFRGRIS
jgi:DNA invertase Pin-like site-specific DNA recombinase